MTAAAAARRIAPLDGAARAALAAANCNLLLRADDGWIEQNHPHAPRHADVPIKALIAAGLLRAVGESALQITYAGRRAADRFAFRSANHRRLRALFKSSVSP